jgi:hypothetical protein
MQNFIVKPLLQTIVAALVVFFINFITGRTEDISYYIRYGVLLFLMVILINFIGSYFFKKKK